MSLPVPGPGQARTDAGGARCRVGEAGDCRGAVSVVETGLGRCFLLNGTLLPRATRAGIQGALDLLLAVDAKADQAVPADPGIMVNQPPFRREYITVRPGQVRILHAS